MGTLIKVASVGYYYFNCKPEEVTRKHEDEALESWGDLARKPLITVRSSTLGRCDYCDVNGLRVKRVVKNSEHLHLCKVCRTPEDE